MFKKGLNDSCLIFIPPRKRFKKYNKVKEILFFRKKINKKMYRRKTFFIKNIVL